MATLGRLIKLNLTEIRQIWPNEEKDLSPWVADNIDILNELLSTQIEIEGREEPIHNFRIDLTGTDNYSQVPVVLENQFGQSDHDHLGKLITYSANKEAGIMIWITNELQAAHKNALDWLNKITPEDMTFYGIELEVVRVQSSPEISSPPAANFRIVAGPPPSKSKPRPDVISPRNKRYQEFFDRLRSKILTIQPNFTRAIALSQSWWSVGIGRSGFSVGSNFTIDNKYRVEIYIDMGKKEQNDFAFDELFDKKQLIEENIGELIWDRLPERRACRIYKAIGGTIDDDEQKLNGYIEWAAPLMVKLKEIFGPLVKNIVVIDFNAAVPENPA